MTLRRTLPPKTRKKKKMLPTSWGRYEKESRPNWGAEGSKKGRTLLPDYSTTAADDEDKWLPRAKPLGKS